MVNQYLVHKLSLVGLDMMLSNTFDQTTGMPICCSQTPRTDFLALRPLLCMDSSNPVHQCRSFVSDLDLYILVGATFFATEILIILTMAWPEC